ncbi:MAG: MOSC domain-containing protein [Chthoniobacter sp.]|nr:MOSC domain-containing protein [Chthoniobacter sp.]
MKLLSVNVAMPREVEISGKLVSTAIYKEPVTGPVWLGRLTLAGDGQADLTVHGGEYQAAYSYPIEHYAHWEKTVGEKSFSPGMFGENFTISGLLEDTVCIGDIWRIGEVRVQVTMPRLPCFKFGHKIGWPAILKEFLYSGYSGFYQRVLSEGWVTAGADIEVLERDRRGFTVRQMLGMQKLDEGDASSLSRALEIECLPPSLRRDLEMRLAGWRR